MKRVGQIIKLKPGAYKAYKQLHAAVWPDVLATLQQANVQNYTIYHWNGFLFAHFDYVGDDWAADSAAIAADPVTQKWWQETDPLQEPVEGGSSGSVEGNWWTTMEELFHMD